MGLDAVEIIMDVEEAFGIQVDDECVSRVRTVGDLYELIVQETLKRETSNSRASCSQCLSAATFRLIRRGLQRNLHLEVARLRPGDRLEAFFPRVGRRQLWNTLQRSLDIKLPALVRSIGVVTALTLVTIASAVFVGLYTVRHTTHVFSIGSALAAAAAVGFILARLSRPLATHFDRTAETFRNFTYAVLARNCSVLSARFRICTSTDIWDALREIIIEQLGVKPQRVTRDALLVEDLGMN